MYFFKVEVSQINLFNFTIILCLFIIGSEDVSHMFYTKSAVSAIAIDLSSIIMDTKCLDTLLNVGNLFLFVEVELRNVLKIDKSRSFILIC